MGFLGDIIGCCNFGRLINSLRHLTDRQLLISTNWFILLCSVYQASVGFAIIILFNHNFRTNNDVVATSEDRSGVSNYFYQALLGSYLIAISLLARKAAKKVNIQLLTWYYWLALMAIPPLFIFSFACLDFQALLRGWISHRWDRPEFDFLRKFLCKDGTWDNKCEAPTNGGPFYATVEEWCIDLHNDTDCGTVRNSAEEDFTRFMIIFMNVNGIVGIVDMILLSISLKLVERTLTLRIIMSSMVDAMNFLLIMPILALFWIGLFLSDHDQLEIQDTWLQYLFFVSSASLLTLALLGIFCTRAKLRGGLILYVFGMGLVGVLIGVAGSASFMMAFNVNEVYGVKGVGKIGSVACSSGLYGCCCCDEALFPDLEDSEMCPEWSREEIIQVVSADYKIAGLVGAISCFFCFSSIRACWLLIVNLKDYKCVYV